MVYSLLLFLFLGFAFVAQALVPAVPWAYQATFCAVHLAFFTAAVTVSYPVMLALAFCAGFAWDALQLAPPSGTGIGGAGDVAFGYSILLLGLTGSLMQGIRPFFRRGRWELPVAMTGVATFLYLTLEYLLINFMRGGFSFPREVASKILATSLLTTLAAPLALLVLYRLAKFTGYRIRYDGLARRYA